MHSRPIFIASIHSFIHSMCLFSLSPKQSDKPVHSSTPLIPFLHSLQMNTRYSPSAFLNAFLNPLPSLRNYLSYIIPNIISNLSSLQRQTFHNTLSTYLHHQSSSVIVSHRHRHHHQPWPIRHSLNPHFRAVNTEINPAKAVVLKSYLFNIKLILHSLAFFIIYIYK